MLDALLTDGAEEKPLESTKAARADDEQVGMACCVEQRLRGGDSLGSAEH